MFAFFEKRLEPFPARAPASPARSLVGFCWGYVKDARWLLALTACLSGAVAAGEAMLFLFLGNLVDWLAAADPSTFFETEGDRLFWLALFVLVLLPGATIVNSLVTHQSLLGNLPMIARWDMHRLMLRQSYAFFANEFAGRVATKVMQTALAVREATMKLLDILVYVLVYFLAMLVIVGSADWRLVLPMLAWVAIYVAIVWYFVPRLRRASARQADARSEMTGRIVDSYTNISTVKLFAADGARGAREEAYARDAMSGFLHTVYPQMRLVTAFYAFVYFNNCASVALVAGASIYLWSEGFVSIGAIATAIALALRIFGMSQWIMWEVSALFENIGVIHDGAKMLSTPVSVVDRDGAPELKVTRGAVHFEGVRFHYGKAGGVIDELTLDIAPGEKVGLVGRSGAGKTTLTNLLLRLYDVEAGAIRIDGVDISGVTQASLRAQIGVVTQDTSLLHRSIRDNIVYGRPGASDEQVARALAQASADEFIDGLEDAKGRRSLDAHVGERGVKLSGGQRQRIAIARIFLKDAPILILDEATSALDSEAEAAIQDNLFSLMEGKTVIAIAHRLSTIASLDRLIVLDGGRIVEEGDHETLIHGGGIYADLWTRQSGGFIGGAARSTAAE